MFPEQEPAPGAPSERRVDTPGAAGGSRPTPGTRQLARGRGLPWPCSRRRRAAAPPARSSPLLVSAQHREVVLELQDRLPAGVASLMNGDYFFPHYNLYPVPGGRNCYGLSHPAAGYGVAVAVKGHQAGPGDHGHPGNSAGKRVVQQGAQGGLLFGPSRPARPVSVAPVQKVGVEFFPGGEVLHRDQGVAPHVPDQVFCRAFLMRTRRVAEVALEEVVHPQVSKVLVFPAVGPGQDLDHGRLGVVVDALGRYAAQPLKSQPVPGQEGLQFLGGKGLGETHAARPEPQAEQVHYRGYPICLYHYPSPVHLGLFSPVGRKRNICLRNPGFQQPDKTPDG